MLGSMAVVGGYPAICFSKAYVGDGTYSAQCFIRATDADGVAWGAEITLVDAGGSTVTPGLIDSHCHVVLGDYTPRQKTVDFLDSYVHGGITAAEAEK